MARAAAIETATMNDVAGTDNTVLTEDVDVNLSDARVRVRVIRNARRGTSLVNFFAKVLGFDTSVVAAMGAARAGEANGVNCPLPFVLVDRWWETTTNALADSADQYTRTVDIYNAGPLVTWPGSTTQPTGYGQPDRGRILRVYPPGPSGAAYPGWAFLLELSDPGGNEVRYWIKSCRDPNAVFEYGDSIEIKNGMTTGPVDQGFTDGADGLIAQDPTAYWGTGPNSPPGGCVFRPGVVDENGEHICVSTPRTKPAFLISPDDVPTSPGNDWVTLRNFVGLFVVCVGVLNNDDATCHGNINSAGGGVWFRFVDYRGVNMAPAGSHPGSLTRIIQLVE
jgi:hypothetical protein